ncbi:MAG: hypothetical protein WDW38_001167 [Sanguina aurantia]
MTVQAVAPVVALVEAWERAAPVAVEVVAWGEVTPVVAVEEAEEVAVEEGAPVAVRAVAVQQETQQVAVEKTALKQVAGMAEEGVTLSPHRGAREGDAGGPLRRRVGRNTAPNAACITALDQRLADDTSLPTKSYTGRRFCAATTAASEAPGALGGTTWTAASMAPATVPRLARQELLFAKLFGVAAEPRATPRRHRLDPAPRRAARATSSPPSATPSDARIPSDRRLESPARGKPDSAIYLAHPRARHPDDLRLVHMAIGWVGGWCRAPTIRRWLLDARRRVVIRIPAGRRARRWRRSGADR